MSTMSTVSNTLEHPPMAVDLESDDDAPMDEEPEVDELDSDPEPVSSKKNAPTRVQGQRTPGTTLLPMQRLETMIQADGIIDLQDISKEGLWMLAVCTEDFIKRLTLHALEFRDNEDHTKKSPIAYDHMSKVIQDKQGLEFLKEIIPRTTNLSEALRGREQKELATVAGDPAVSAGLSGESTPPRTVPYGTNPYLSYTQTLVQKYDELIASRGIPRAYAGEYSEGKL